MATIPYSKQFVKSDGRRLNRSGPRDMQARTSGSYTTPDTSIVELLTNQLTELRAEVLAMKSRSGDDAPAGFFSPEQVDAEITKAVEAAIVEAAISFKGGASKNADLAPLVSEYKKQVLELQRGNDNLTKLHATITKENSDIKSKISKLNEELVDVNDLRKQIAVLEQEVVGKQELIETLKSRPAILEGEVFTDPDRPQLEQVFVDPLEKDAGKGMKASISIETVVKDEEVGDKVDKLKGLLGKLPNK
jgi:predicted nuclease with TOPRIM domain